MKGPGVLWMIQTAAGLSMAGPMFVIGVSYLFSGDPLGVGFLALGAIALYLPTYFVNQIGGPRTWIRQRRNAADEESDTDTASERANATGGDDERRSFARRVRRWWSK
ncbi:hypothetical protein [Natronobacterium gregoryi]|uniref:Uncharacterized protein n=2 Tax=Natronobacterium gregoryi TaxID=44930 RepID=G4G4E7_NATGS|nr:hypothetical protein [Natronobacterium gregoryi]AFZ73211.1 hypothetical protein Natgr_2028 [Natronobacterium gregoryi SP2]ELY71331.1 hypothetical protein C490_05352 [Natronobacterium gregoryi SP2]PLK21618.1 hypothetical protein CYV19_03400 [Natronobacterium gregoryi SP2]SFI58325.1 hypothetical protein SAMN05443661_10253 [Natronobacterium gregoryi]